MSSNAAVRTAWASSVWANINNGENAYSFEILPNSEKLVADKAYYKNRIDFWTYSVSSKEEPAEIGAPGRTLITFTVAITRYLEVETDPISYGERYKEAQDDLRTVNDYVLDNLGAGWGGTVNFYRGPSDPQIDLSEFAGKPVIRARTAYTAQKIQS